MTALQDEALTHWTRVQPLRARNPLLLEMAEAAETAATEQNPMRQAFHVGLFTGYAVGFGLFSREALENARRTPRSHNVHFDFWQPSPSADTDSAWACGVRHGYWLATSERRDADECEGCGERLIDSLDDVEYCDDGAFCALEGCKREWHANGPNTCGGE